MASRQQELKSVISVYGKADSSLETLSAKIGKLGSDLTRIGTAATLATAPILAAVKQSTSLYADYDDILRKIQAAGGYTQAQMETIGAAARQAGADTRYMASDAAGAFLSLTQAGVSLQDSLETLPTLLNAAAAGGMELTDASDLLISNIYSLGKSFTKSDVTGYMDMVSTAADNANTTMQELMEGVSTVGAAGRLFAGGESELLAFLSLLADLNRKGSEGGIDARNMIISLLAPTNTASKLMKSLDVTEEELSETLEGVDLKASAAAMKEIGLETVDAQGKVRPMIDIMTDLKKATDKLSDDEKARVLNKIFSKRTYASAVGILELLDEYPDVIAAILDSAGATEEKAQILESGIGGATRTLQSAFEELQLSAGEAASEKVMEWIGMARDFMLDAADFIKGLDTDDVNKFLDTLAGVAGTGAGLTLAGGALKGMAGIVAAISTPGGKLALGAAALGALAFALDAVQDAAAREELDNHFGALEVDSEKAEAWMNRLSNYTSAAESLNSYADAIEAAGENYQTYVSALSGGLLEAYLTQNELTEEDKTALTSYATAIVDEVKGAISTQKLALDDLLSFAYDGTGEGDAEKSAGWSALGNAVFGSLMSEAESAGSELTRTLYDAMFDDGQIDEEELAAIERGQKKVNEIMARVQAYQAQYNAKMAYAKAMYMSDGSLETIFEAADAQYSANKDYIDQSWLERFTEVLMAQEEGTALPEEFLRAYGLSGAQDYEGALTAMRQEWQSDLTDARIATDEAKARAALKAMSSVLDEGADGLAGQSYAQMLTPFMDVVAQALAGAGADELDTLAQQALNRAQEEAINAGGENPFFALQNGYGMLENSFSLDQIEEDLARQAETTGQVSGALLELYQQLLAYKMAQGESAILTDERAKNLQAYGQLAVGEPEGAEQSAQDYVGIFSGVIEQSDIQMKVSTPDGNEAAESFRSEVQENFNSMPALLNVLLNPLSASSSPDKLRGKQLTAYATGGYADSPSLFGEDGGEWAIPQEKTENTRTLLRRAAAGSGFSPEELYPERGEKTAMSFTFAPTIYAADAQGVRQTLEEERAQMMELMEQWWSEKMRDKERVSFA